MTDHEFERAWKDAEQALREAGFHGGQFGRWWRGAHDTCQLSAKNDGRATICLHVPLTALPVLLRGGYTEEQVEKAIADTIASFHDKQNSWTAAGREAAESFAYGLRRRLAAEANKTPSE